MSFFDRKFVLDSACDRSAIPDSAWRSPCILLIQWMQHMDAYGVSVSNPGNCINLDSYLLYMYIYIYIYIYMCVCVCMCESKNFRSPNPGSFCGPSPLPPAKENQIAIHYVFLTHFIPTPLYKLMSLRPVYTKHPEKFRMTTELQPNEH